MWKIQRTGSCYPSTVLVYAHKFRSDCLAVFWDHSTDMHEQGGRVFHPDFVGDYPRFISGTDSAIVYIIILSWYEK